MESLAAAGFPEPWIFAEPDSPQVESLPAGAVVVHRAEPSGGAFPNFWLACSEMLTRFPHAERFLIAQDDALFAGGDWKQEVASLPCWQLPQFGMLTLFASAKYDRFRTGSDWFEFPKHERWLYSAQAMVFTRDSLLHFTTSEPAKFHSREPERKRQRYVDTLVGNWARKHKRSVWLPAVSIVKHIGDSSTLWEAAPSATGWRNCSTFRGDTAGRSTQAEPLIICVALCNRGPAFAKLIATLTRSWAACQQPIELRVADFASDDVDVQSIVDSLLYSARLIRLERPFNRSVGLNVAAAGATGLLAFVDADMDLPPTFISDARVQAAPGVAWAPICYSLHEGAPAVVAGDGEPPANGWWRHTGWGNLVVSATDFEAAGGFDTDIGRTWGREDEDLRDGLLKNAVKLKRDKYEGFFHRWHANDLRHLYHAPPTLIEQPA